MALRNYWESGTLMKSFKLDNRPPVKKSIKLTAAIDKDAGIKEVFNNVYTWIRDKLSSEEATEIEIRREVEDRVDTAISTDEEVSPAPNVPPKIVEKIVEKLKNEESENILVPSDEEEVIDEEVEEADEEELDYEELDDMSVVAIIKDAASTKKLLWIRYRDQEGNETEREVEPWEIRDDYYMFAHDPEFTSSHGSDIGTRQFIIAAILDMHVTDKPYLKPTRWEMKI